MTKKDKKQKVHFYVFYHDPSKLAQVDGGLNRELFTFVNLNKLKLPTALIIPGMEPEVNRALYAEYLGILSIKPHSEMVGCFTYSIPLKFSVQWATETGNFNLFLPEIRFEYLTVADYDPGKLYAPEFNDPRHMFKKIMAEIHAKFPAGPNFSPGPFKGSFIVRGDIFSRFQEWFMRVAAYLVANYHYQEITSVTSPFGKSAISSRSKDQLALDKIRSTYGAILERTLAYYLGCAYSSEQKVKLGWYLLTARVKHDELLSEAVKHSRRNNIIIAIANSEYAAVVDRWLSKLKALQIENYLIVASDRALYDSLKAKNENVTYRPFNGDLCDFWTYRLEIIQTLLTAGINVIHSDPDAFWLDDPLDEYFNGALFDILASQGTVHPHETLALWGFVLCCGLIYYRSSPPVLDFFSRLVDKSRVVKEDQRALNILLDELKVEWECRDADYTLTYNGRDFNCYNDILKGQCAGMSLGILPHTRFQRIYENTKPYVAHLISDKEQESKLDTFAKIDSYSTWNSKAWSIKALKSDREQITNNLIWLASYPRSGNTMLRILLNHCFGLKSYSIHDNDPNDIGKIPDVADIVGHKNLDWSFSGKEFMKLKPADYNLMNHFRYERAELSLVKTHSRYHYGYAPDRVIYIYRDGRAALRSHASYQYKFRKRSDSRRTRWFATGLNNEEEALDELLCCGAAISGPWSEHALGWLRHPKERILFLKFEDVVSNFPRTIERIADFIGITPVREDMITFGDLNAINADFFRKGEKKSWQDIFDPVRNALFWTLNYEAMFKLGYHETKSSLGVMLPPGDNRIFCMHPSYGSKVSEATLRALDEMLRQCAVLFAANLDYLPAVNRQVIAKRFGIAYIFYKKYFANYSDGRYYRWIGDWEKIYSHHIFKKGFKDTSFIYLPTLDLKKPSSLETLKRIVNLHEFEHVPGKKTVRETSAPSCEVNFSLIESEHSEGRADNYYCGAFFTLSKTFCLVTKVFDSCTGLDETISSVVNQQGDFQIHYHVIDCSEKKYTATILQRWEKYFANEYEHSGCLSVTFSYSSAPGEEEKDEGQLVSKVFRSMEVPHSAFMSALPVGAQLLPGTLETLLKIDEQFPNVQWVGGCNSDLAGVLPTGKSAPEFQLQEVTDNSLPPFCGGVFFRKSLWFKTLGFAGSNEYVGNEAWARAFAHHATCYRIARPFAVDCEQENDRRVRDES